MGVGVRGSFYKDDLMDTVTDEGKGSYIFIDSKEEAYKMFGERFLSNVELAARDVQVELTLPPGFSMVEFHGEEYSENPCEVEPQHLAPNDAMIFHQEIETCDPDGIILSDEVQVKVTFKEPFARVEKLDSLNTTLGELLKSDVDLILKGDAIVAYAKALNELCYLYGEEAKKLIDTTLATVNAAKTVLFNDPDLAEIEGLLISYRNQF